MNLEREKKIWDDEDDDEKNFLVKNKTGFTDNVWKIHLKKH
jgi:hypothetical protein